MKECMAQILAVVLFPRLRNAEMFRLRIALDEVLCSVASEPTLSKSRNLQCNSGETASKPHFCGSLHTLRELQHVVALSFHPGTASRRVSTRCSLPSHTSDRPIQDATKGLDIQTPVAPVAALSTEEVTEVAQPNGADHATLQTRHRHSPRRGLTRCKRSR